MKLPVLSGFEMVKVLHRKGWIAARQTSSHIVMQRKAPWGELSVPQHRTLKRGIVHECIVRVGLTEEDF